VLLVFDNFERVIEARLDVAELITSCPNLDALGEKANILPVEEVDDLSELALSAQERRRGYRKIGLVKGLEWRELAAAELEDVLGRRGPPAGAPQGRRTYTPAQQTPPLHVGGHTVPAGDRRAAAHRPARRWCR
jgi:hypothetical protein